MHVTALHCFDHGKVTAHEEAVPGLSCPCPRPMTMAIDTDAVRPGRRPHEHIDIYYAFDAILGS
jgi:hypothetical protein